MRVGYEQMRQVLARVLTARGMGLERAARCAQIFSQNSLDGVASHGLNRFPTFVRFMEEGWVKPNSEPVQVAAFGAWEQWDGQLGPGPLNAEAATRRAMALAHCHGVGCVGLRNTNHWMRGGTYGWQAAEAGYGLICWTNTTPNMPPWGAVDLHIGNNPLVMAVPRADGPLVLDMATSQFSLGRMATAFGRGETLPVAGGYDASGVLTGDPEAILASRRPLPMGYWKGSGLTVLLDLMAALLSGGRTTVQIGREEVEYAVSQAFIAFDLSKATTPDGLQSLVDEVILDLHAAQPAVDGGEVLYPGERALRTRRANLELGIPVDPEIWEQVLAL